MIDFHCHLDLYPDPESVARECKVRGTYVLSVTNTPSAWAGTETLRGDAPRVRTGLGLHPELAGERRRELPLFERLVGQTRYVGEIGLDGGAQGQSHWSDQQYVFRRVLQVCGDVGGKILSIHSRRAASAVLGELDAHPSSGTPILHWFSGSVAELKRAIELDCWFSVGPAMLAGRRGRDLLARMPVGRVLTETDGPFASVGRRALLPWESSRAVPVLAKAWGLDEERVEKQLAANLRELVTPNRPSRAT